MPIETFNILFENTQNKQQYGTNITCIEVRLKKRFPVISKMYTIF